MLNAKRSFVFFGTSTFAVKVLDDLRPRGQIPTLIITQPDSPQGRKLVLTPSPVKIWAGERSIPCLAPEELSNFEFLISKLNNSDINSKLEIRNLKLFDLFIVAAYGKIIPDKILYAPKLGTINVHPSLLPKYRGPSPIQHAIINGEKETGVSIISLDDKVDHGPIIAQKILPIQPEDTFSSLETILAVAGADLLSEILKDPEKAIAEAKEQDHAAATFTKKIEKASGFIPKKVIFGKIGNQTEAVKYDRLIRAYYPAPLAHTIVTARSGRELRVQILKAEVKNDKLIPLFVKPEGKKEMSWSDFENGYL